MRNKESIELYLDGQALPEREPDEKPGLAVDADTDHISVFVDVMGRVRITAIKEK